MYKISDICSQSVFWSALWRYRLLKTNSCIDIIMLKGCILSQISGYLNEHISEHLSFTELYDWPNYPVEASKFTLQDLQGHVFKCGGATGLTRGWIIKDPKTKSIKRVSHNGVRCKNGPIPMTNQLVIKSSTHTVMENWLKPFANCGDSGSIIFILKENNTICPVAMVQSVKISREPVECYATPVDAVLEVLKNMCGPSVEIMGFI